MKFKIALFLSLPTLLLANVVWPALFLEQRLFSWWAIGFGLLVEFFAIQKIFDLEKLESIIAVTVANTISTLLGVFLIPISGIAWEFFPAQFYNDIFGWGTFNPLTWIGTFLLASLVNAFVEGVAYKKIFKIELLFRSREFTYLFLANTLSASIAMMSLLLFPIKT